MSTLIAHILFGQVSFPENEEYQEFQYKFLMVLMVSGALFTAFFIVASATNVNPLRGPHMYSMMMFSAVALGLSVALRNRKHLFYPVAWIYEITCLLEYSSALFFVPEDEVRLLWFFVNIPGVFILLGKKTGWYITFATIFWLTIANTYLSRPYSQPAIATSIVAMLYLGVFFHVYSNRSISYFTRMRECNVKLAELATHDPLTGVLNARAYYAQCDQYICRTSRRTAGYSVLFIDLDHFKSVNDNHGHAAGDTVLKTVAESLRANIRRSDILGRIGGEEFAIFLPDTNTVDASQVAETIRVAIEASMPNIGERTLKITASIGVAGSTETTQSMLHIQQQADQAMYKAKSQGRNRVSVLGKVS